MFVFVCVSICKYIYVCADLFLVTKTRREKKRERKKERKKRCLLC